MESERKTIKLQTLTPVHIGSGEILKENFDYIKDNRFVYILDSKKLFNLLKQKNFSIAQRTNALISGNIKTIIDRYLSNISSDNYCIRKIQIQPNQREKVRPGLREQIYDGFGKPYIPGSSIKGAIRTALLSHIIDCHFGDIDDDDLNAMIKVGNEITDDNIIKQAFVKEVAKEDCNFMKCIQVSDCYPENNTLEILNTTLLNINKSSRFISSHANQIVECFPENSIGKLSLKISETDIPFRLKLSTLQELFKIINSKTKETLNAENDTWGKYKNKSEVSSYLSAIDSILKELKDIDDNSCIIRVGFANGYNFMTDRWTDFLSGDIQNQIAKKVNSKYRGGPFPKSRRINIIGTDRNMKVNILGFVKLTIENNK